MADQKNYQPHPFLYTSRGLAARWELDRVPPGYYIGLMNNFEREESAMSSRYGSQFINRDPDGTPSGRNYSFPSPVTSLGRLTYLASAFRYAGTAAGVLYRRAGDTQGQYTQIHSGLSGNPFQSLVTTCYETAQPYLFIYDAAISLKDDGLLATPQLIGIDPPPYTANTVPYSPLLTLIDDFADGNTYTTSNVSGWAWAAIVTLASYVGSKVTDFPQFFQASDTISGGTTQAVATGTQTIVSTVYSGFASTPISAGVPVTLNFTFETQGKTDGAGYGNASVAYSIDGGATYAPAIVSQSVSANQTIGPLPYSISINGLSNLDQLYIKVTSTANGGTLGLGYVVYGTIGSISAAQAGVGAFGLIANGMLSIIGSTAPVSIGILSIASSGLTNGIYTTLTITTAGAHGLTGTPSVAIYGCSNALCDGFYTATVTGASTLTVPFVSVAALSATLGTLWSNTAATPKECILANLYTSPYPTQLSAWGFYTEVPTSVTSFPVGGWSGTVATNTTGTVAVTTDLDLSQNNQVTDFDLIVLTLRVTNPANIASIQLQFDVNGSGYTSAYYSATLSPAYYQGSITGQQAAYQATQNQVIADTLGILTGQQPTGSTTAQLSPSNFSTGSGTWIAVYIPRGNFLPIGNAGQSGLDWGNITGWQLVIETTATPITGDGSATVSANGLYLQWGYGPSSFAGTGYDWRYTYYNAATGTESNGSPEQQFNQQWGYLASRAAPLYLRQAAQVNCLYSTDSQVTHVRGYRRGGIYGSNWLLTTQIPNVVGGGPFSFKDVVTDAALAQAQPLALDNDPPVTSSLIIPIQTTLAAATTGPGSSIYSTFAPQTISVADSSAQFVLNQTVLVGNADNLEEVLVTGGGTGQFTAVLRLQHNAGEQVSATSVPRQPPSICALAYNNQSFVVDPLNPANVFFSKEGYPENFGPQNYFPVAAPDDQVMALINWRGTLVAATQKTWKIVVGGAKPYAQPTGAAHGLASRTGWTLVEGRIVFQAPDGWREFSGAEGAYMTLPVEWMFRAAPPTIIPPRLDPAQYGSVIMAYYQNQVYGSFVSSASDGGVRYRLRFDDLYKRFGLDDVPATAMLWEQDINAFLVARPFVTASNSVPAYGIAQDWIGDYDDGGWNADGTALITVPINLAVQTPFGDWATPHNPKEFNVLEGDYDTQNQPIQTTLYFKGEEDFSIALPAANLGAGRSKYQFQIAQSQSVTQPAAAGVEAYSVSIEHRMAVTVAPTLFQENVYAAVLAEERTSFDSWWQKIEGDYLGILPKNLYVDYSTGGTAAEGQAGQQLIVSVFADGSLIPYYIDDFTLIAQADRSVVRVQLPARKGRLWRVIITSAAPFQLWSPVRADTKPLAEGSAYAETAFPV